MKIAFLNIYNGVIERGSEIFVRELATKLSNHHTISVFQSGKKDNKTYQVKYIKNIHHQKNQGFIYNFWVFIFTLKCLNNLWQEKYDWIIPINGSLQIVICRLLRFLKGGKILISGHAGVGFDDKFNIILGSPDIFVAISPLACLWAKKFTKRIEYIPNGIDLERFNPAVKPAKICLKSPVILCNSALLPYKRIDLTIKAISKLKDASLLIIGDGELKKEIDALGKSLLGDKFLLIEKIPHKDIASYYRSARLFTLVSRSSEAFGLVYLEALACNIAVVASDDINRREIIGQAGLFCDPENIDEYAATIQKALNINWGDKPKKQAEKFSWNKIAEKYDEVFQKYQ